MARADGNTHVTPSLYIGRLSGNKKENWISLLINWSDLAFGFIDKRSG